MKNKKEIQAAILTVYEALNKVEDLLTPEVKEWANGEGFDSDDEVAIDIINFGPNLVDIGKDLDGE